MRTNTTINRRARFLAGVAPTLLLFGLAGPAFAQEAEDDSEALPSRTAAEPGDQPIVVTGSRIASPALTAPNPISQISSEEFTLSSSATAENLLNTLPQVVPGESGFTNNESSGVATVNLRGLGEQRNLVLVNGRRYIFFDARQVTDLNTVPTGLVDRVELVTGGSSAVYGSDAVSGVVNFVLKDDFEGLEVTGQYDVTAHGDAAKANVDVILGGNFADDRGNATIYFNYFDRNPTLADARNRSFCFLEDIVVNGTPTLQCGGSAGIPNGRFAGLPVGAALTARPQVGAALAALGLTGIDANGFKFDSTGTQVSRFVVPGDRYNFNPDNYLQLPQERRIIGAMANYDVTDRIEVYFEGIYTNNIVKQQTAATPVGGSYLFQTNSPFLTPGVQALFRALDETETSAATRGDGFTTLSIGRRIEEGRVRTSQFERNAWRAVGGLRGDIGSLGEDFLKDIKFDGYYSYARTRNVRNNEGVIQQAAFTQGVTTVFRNPATGATSPFPFAGVPNGGELVCRDASNGCVPLNIFGPLISEAGINFITGRSTSSEEAEMQVATGIFTGTLFDLPAGPVGFALGVEWRDVSAFFIPSSGGIGDVGQISGGGYDVKEIFGEIRVPVFDGFELNGAFRYSDYSLENVGGVWTYGGGATWQVFDSLMIRGQYQRAVRAPSVDELYRSQSGISEAATDPCATAAAAAAGTLRDLCIATGVPSASVGNSGIQPSFQLRGIVGGNPDLQEETTDTYTLGAVLRPLRRLSVTLDYYNISIEDAIFRAPLQSVLDLCYTEFQDVGSFYCQSVMRLPDGTIGNPGGIAAPFDNIGSIKTDGIDASVSYSFDTSSLIPDSNFSIAGSLNWLNSFERNPVSTFASLTLQCEGAFGLSCGEPLPEWKGTARATLEIGEFTASLRYRYIGKVTDDRITRGISQPSALAVPYIDPEHYFDLSLSWDIEPLTVFGGVVNMTNNKQQLIGSSQEQLNTFPSTYDPLGVRFYFGATLKL